MGQLKKLRLESLPIQVQVVKTYDDYLIVKGKNKYIVYDDYAYQYEPGTIIDLQGEYLYFDEMNIEHTFNYNQYLKSKRILGIIKAHQIEIVSKKLSVNIIPYHISNYISQKYPSEVATYIKLFILGDKEDLDETIKQGSIDLGISHLFAISGMHLGFMVLILNKILHLFYLKKKTHNIIICLFLSAYNIISGFTVSIVRASLFSILLIISKDNQYKLNISDYLSIIFISMIMYNPYYIYNIGFQLSFLITFVLIIFKHLYTDKRGLKKVFLISLIAYLFSLPITLSINKSLGLLNVIFNPFFIIFVTYFLLPGALLVLLVPYFSLIYEKLIFTFEKMIVFSSSINTYYEFNFSSSFIVLFFWIGLILTLTYKGKGKKKIITMYILLIIFFSQQDNTFQADKVVIFDVNQGDAALIYTKDCKLLIDTGKADDYDNLIHYFKGENINDLDGAILTHQHQDHYGEISDILKSISIKKLYVSKIFQDLELERQVLVGEGHLIQCGSLSIHVLNGFNGLENENNNSLVIYTIISNETWLFTGDIEKEVEEKLIEKYRFEIDHLKVAHHGSNTSTSIEFLQHFKVKNAYISSGKNNYGIPSENVLLNLRENTENLYITHQDGTIVNVYSKLLRYNYLYHQGKKHYRFY